jgi:hypothetical protein
MSVYTVVDPGIKRFWILPRRGQVNEFRYQYNSEIRSINIPEQCFFAALQAIWPVHFPSADAQERAGLPVRHGPAGFLFERAEGPNKRHYNWNGTHVIVTRLE